MKRSCRNGLALIICLVCIACLALPADAFECGARGVYWFPFMKAGSTGTELNVKDDLSVGISDTNGNLEFHGPYLGLAIA